MSDEVNEEVVNENPESELDLTDAQLDALLEQAEVNEEGDLTGDLEFTSDEATEEEGEEEEGEEEGEEKPDDSEEEEEGEEESAEEDDELAGLDPAARTAMENVLQRLELMETEREAMSAELERERMLRDRNAGKLGSLMQKLENDQDGDALDSDDDADGKTATKSQDAGEEALAMVRQEKVIRAMDGASRDFYSANEAFFNALTKEAGAEANESFQADLIAKVQEHQKSLGDDLITMSPKMAAKVSDTLLRSAFADVKLTYMRDFQEKASEKSEASRRNIRARKKGAAGARSNKAPTAKSTQTKSLSQMSDAELDAALAEAASSFD